MANFKKATFDEAKYRNEAEALQKWAEKINNLRDSLLKEGLPADKAFIERITAGEMAFDSFIKKEYTNYLGKVGFIPREEKQRILENYNTLFYGLNPLVQECASAIHRGIVLEPDGTVNEKKLEERAREAGTTVYDVDLMKSFYEVVEKAKKAIEDVEKYEKKNGIDTAFTQPLHSPGACAILPPRIISFKGNEADFQRDFGDYFTEKKLEL